VQTQKETRTSIRNLHYLPSFAAYILNNKLQDYVRFQIQYSRQLNIPLLKSLSHLSEDQLINLSLSTSKEFLTYIADNKAEEQIEAGLSNWKSNTLPVIDKFDIIADDITLITYLRKQALIQFLPGYCSSTEQVIEIVKEIDLYSLESETKSTNFFINLLKERIEEQDKRYKQAEAITHIGNYLWDLSTGKLEWSEELYHIYEIDPSIGSFESRLIEKYNHPDDAEEVKKIISDSVANGNPFDFYYRIIPDSGIQKILRARGEIIKDKNNKVIGILGTAQDVTEKQTLIQKLKDTESLYKQAEELANMGNWTWDIKNKKLQWTDQLYKIYGMEPQSEEVTIQKFLSFVHPDDREEVAKGISLFEKQDFLDFIFRIVTKDGKTKTLRSIAQVKKDKNGKIVSVIGTERDTTEKQNLINRLRQSEELYKQAQALAHVGNWTLDLNTMELLWSDEMYIIYELEIGTKVTVNDWKNFIHPQEMEEVLNYLEDCMKNFKPYDKIHRIVLGNKKVKTIHRKAEFIFDSKGKAISMLGTSQDVTEDYQIQQELRESQKFIRKITDATPSIIASYNVNTGKYVYISEGLQKLLGYATEMAMEKGVAFFEEIIHPEDVTLIMAKNAAALEEANNSGASDLVVEFTYRMKHKNGQYRWFHTYGTIFDRNKQHKVEHVLNISLDITDQVNATEKIKEQEHFIQQIADASPTILYLYDIEKASIEYINREIFFVLGYLPEEIIEAGSEVTKMLYYAEDFHLLPARKESKKTFQQVDSMIQYECRMVNKQGELRWLLVREIVFKTDENGNIKQILGAALDINHRKEMEKTILQNTLQLEQSNASLEEFAYVASHDLKEPLRKISTFGDRLVATQMNTLTQDGKLYLQKIVDASQRMQTMISDLLSISMITGNRSFETFSLQKILDETLQTLEFKIEQLNAVIKSDPLPEANIIPSQFRQLFQNLLSNSLKFIRPGVQPVITITHKYLDNSEVVHYQLNQAEKYHKLEFADNGIGFENEFAGKIFAIFQRLHGRSEYEGSGIGLAICKKIVEHHGGIIYANGTPDKGSTFTILIPA
jgi:PAS domain S-box-containing protein